MNELCATALEKSTMPSEQEYAEDLSELFNRVQQLGDDTLYRCLYHTCDTRRYRQYVRQQGGDADGIAPEWRFTLIHRVLHNNTNLVAFTRFIEAKGTHPDFLLLYLKLNSYLQVVETRYTYKVVGNCLRALLHQALDGALFDNQPSGYSCFKQVETLYATLHQQGDNFSLFDKWAAILDRDLRNAIAHNDYIIDSAAGVLLVPYYLINQTINPAIGDRQKSIYTFDEIEFLFNEASRFNESFRTTCSRYIDLGARY